MKETNSTTSTLATRPVAAVPAQRIAPAPSRLAGAEPEDVQLPRLHLMQGMPAERTKYGDYKDGTLFNTITGEVIASREDLPTKKFIVLFGFVEYIKWREPMGSGMEYRTRDKSQVPRADLEWVETAKGRKPAVTKYINWVVVFEGTTDPVVLSFKSTSLKTGQAIETMERTRAFAATLKKDGQPTTPATAFYALSLRSESKKGNTWLHPQARPMGNATPEMEELAEAMRNSFSAEHVTTNIDGDEPDADGNGGNGGAPSAGGDGSDFDPNARE